MSTQEQIHTFIYSQAEPMRIDAFLVQQMDSYTRNRIQQLIEEGQILVNEKSIKASYKLKENDCITVKEPPLVITQILPENIPLDILYEDEDILVINKPKGMVVHPAPGHTSGTLVNAILYHCKDLSGINGELRPGIVHRIDKDTTGSLLVCKNDRAHTYIAKQLQEHSIRRIYRGIVRQPLTTESGTISTMIGRDPKNRKKMSITVASGRSAITHYRLIQNFKETAYVEFSLETGRTHQIRVHMASIGHSLLGDEVYGTKKCKYNLQGQTLHAMTIGFYHPTSEKYMEFHAPLPEYFQHLLEIMA